MADRTCYTCAFDGTPSYKMPCSSCHPTYDGRTNWTEKQKKQTNADKFFRNATDEQIARFLVASQAEILEVFCKKLGYPEAVAATSTADTAASAWLDWLGKEASDDEATVESFARRS